jgi:hypothetical protein
MSIVSAGLTYYTDQEVDNLLTAVFQIIIMQMEFFSRIINLVPDTIESIEESIRVIE